MNGLCCGSVSVGLGKVSLNVLTVKLTQSQNIVVVVKRHGQLVEARLDDFLQLKGAGLYVLYQFTRVRFPLVPVLTGHTVALQCSKQI